MDAHLFLEGELDGPALVSLTCAGTVLVYTHYSPVRGAPNQDALGVFELGPERVVLAVADGLGGHAHGEQAARTALETLAESLAEAREGEGEGGLGRPIVAAIEQANAALLERDPSPATTLLVATIEHGQLRTYNVGDSELLVVGQRGKLKLHTTPHSPVGYALDAGLLDETAAMVHEERHYLSNAVGMAEMHVSTTSGLELAARDTVVLGSDGLFDNLFRAEIIELVRAGEPFERAHALVQCSRARMLADSPDPETPSKPDDLSFILFRPASPNASTLARAKAGPASARARDP